MAPVMGALSHMRPVTTSNLDFIFPREFSPYFVESVQVLTSNFQASLALSEDYCPKILAIYL
jgi:hypothetical protein